MAASASLHSRLELLSRLGHRLPSISSTEMAAAEVVAVLASIGLGSIVASVEGDTAVLQAARTRTVPGSTFPEEFASRLVGLRVPIDGIRSISQAIRLHRPYRGPAGAVETLRGLMGDTAMARALADEDNVIAVPVISRERAVAVMAVWGPSCVAAMTPTLEVVAAMLGAIWDSARSQEERFPPIPAGSRPARRTAIRSLLASGRIVAAVQPLVRLSDESVIGYEALARFPPNLSLVAPDDLFASAAALSMQAAVDIACIRAAVRAFPSLGGVDLFVNVLIGTLLDPSGMATLDRVVHEAHVDPRAMVFEFSEREPIPDLTRLQRIAAELRGRGFRIAVDDAGAGHASMRLIAEVRPEFIKVDRSLIHSIDTDGARRALVVALLSFSGHIGSRLVAEGVETVAEKRALLSLGVQFGQGWGLGVPVLTEPLEGHPEIEVVDESWFAHRTVATTGPRTGTVLPSATAPATIPSRPSRPGGGLARALSDAAQALQNEHDPMRILNVIADQLCGVVPVKEMAIYVADYETHQMIPVLATGPEREEILADTFSLDAGLAGWALAQGTAQNISDASTHPLARQVPGTPVEKESLLLVPLVAGDHKLGLISCWREGVDRFSGRDLEAAGLFGHIASSAWHNAQLYEELLNAAMTDPLTRLYNSRWLRDAAHRDLERAARDGLPVTLLLLDLDHFKMVNDSAGHAAGDLLLQRVALQLRTAVRATDAVVRLGGEEFVVLLHAASLEQAARIGEALRVAVRQIPVPAGSPMERLTVSVGIAAHPQHGEDLDQLLAAADRAMYSAKHNGRDRVCIAAPAHAGAPRDELRSPSFTRARDGSRRPRLPAHPAHPRSPGSARPGSRLPTPGILSNATRQAISHEGEGSPPVALDPEALPAPR
ncbi:MAG TPA: diguanylate cyclase [Candidatus Binatia bacterium]|nr:diguanylate cyclase [Candidatus Binatia bacterium]